MVNTNDYEHIGQHNMQLRIRNGMGIHNSRALEIGLLENGTGIIQANEDGIGYNNLALNPVNGNVGIGTTSPQGPLHVTASGTTNGKCYFHLNQGTGLNNSMDLVFKSNSYEYGSIGGVDMYGGAWLGGLTFKTYHGTDNASIERMRIDYDGNVGIGTTSPGSYKLNVIGNVNATSYNAASDYRIKENVVPISDTSYNIDNIRPVTYTNTKMERQDFGVIAHELQEQIPFLVTGKKDDEHHQSVNYNGLIGLLLNEVQQLKKRVQELEQSKP